MIIYTLITNHTAWLIILFKFNQYLLLYSNHIIISESTSILAYQKYYSSSNFSLYWIQVGRQFCTSPTIIHTQEMHGCLDDQLFSKIQLCFFTTSIYALMRLSLALLFKLAQALLQLYAVKVVSIASLLTIPFPTPSHQRLFNHII